MKDFEQLLHETLQDVRDVEPLTGMEARILARVGSEDRSGSRWRLLSGAVAAGLLVAVLFQDITRRHTKPPVAVTYVAASSVDCLTAHETCPSAEGETHISLGRRPGDASRTKQTGLKARNIGATHRLQARSKLPRNAYLRIAPIVIAPLRMEQIELASLTLKNRIERGETQ